MHSKKTVLILLIIAISLTGCDLLWQRYSNREYRFSILLPRFWQKEEAVEHTVIMAKSPLRGKADRIQENVNVVVNDFPEEISLTTFFELNKAEIMNVMPGVEYDISEGKIFAGSQKGRWLAFDANIGDSTLRIISAAWIKNRRVYVVTCSADKKEYPKYEPTFKKILRSLRIK